MAGQPEPKRESNLSLLEPYIAGRVERILARMKARGFDPEVFESLRSSDRQKWLYGRGRTAFQCIKAGISPKWAAPWASVVTKTTKSVHIRGKAVDIVSHSKLWSWPEFFKALKEEAAKEGMHTLGFEQCHVEWRG